MERPCVFWEAMPTPTQHLDFTIDEDTEEEFCTWVEVKRMKKGITGVNSIIPSCPILLWLNPMPAGLVTCYC